MLYLVPTPIGNLEDITFRAVQILKDADLILAEDTRTSRKVMDRYEIKTKLKAFHAFNEHHSIAGYVQMMQAGSTIALISDAGTPGISDPGFLMVRACVEAGVPVSCLPGPTAFVPALVGSGLPCDKFYYEGFLPHKKGRQTRYKYLAKLPCTFILYESPHRIIKCMEGLAEFCGPDRKACVVREISKMFETFDRGTLAELITFYKSKQAVKGEIVLVVAGAE